MAWALGRIGPKASSAIDALALALKDPKQGVRTRAALAIGLLGSSASQEAASSLAEVALLDENPGVRGHAAQALSKLYQNR